MSDGQGQVHQVVVLGSGPAGLTAALYTARAGLKPLVLHGNTPGGQLTTTSIIENYPGFASGIDANELIDAMSAQAKNFGTEFMYASLKSADLSSRPFKLTFEDNRSLSANTLIIATGARPRKLGLPSEDTYWSKGVTSCATCDGPFYKNQEVCVIGGGDSAMEEAQHLSRLCSKVYLIHRRDSFRASKIMTQRTLNNPKIEVVWNSVVEEIVGDGKHVTGARLKNIVNNTCRLLDIKCVFLAIGHIPNTDPFLSVIKHDENGYLLTESGSTRTNIPGVFACGDCVDHVYRQAITAAGTGCQAAIDAERWLEEQHK